MYVVSNKVGIMSDTSMFLIRAISLVTFYFCMKIYVLSEYNHSITELISIILSMLGLMIFIRYSVKDQISQCSEMHK